MKPMACVTGACVAGGVTVLAVMAGLDGMAQAAETTARAANRGDVVINEVAWSGTMASTADEWVELYNTTAVTISLNGWHLDDDDSLQIPLSGDVPPYGYYLIERTDDNTISDIPAGWFGSFGSGGLHNDGEVLTLTDGLDNVIDTANGAGGGWPGGSGSPNYYSMERADPYGPDADTNWCSNDGMTRNGLDAIGSPVNGTPKAPNSCYQPPAGPVAELSVAKSGPVSATPGTLITYYIAISNTGAITATAAVLTDTLPAGVDFVIQTSPFSFTSLGRDVVWQLGDVPTGTRHFFTVTGRVTDTASGALLNQVTAACITSETLTANNTDSWTTTVGAPQVLVAGVLYDGYQTLDRDEAVLLVNIGDAPAVLTDWRLCDEASGGTCAILPSVTLSVGQRIWLANWATDFYTSFGFLPDLAARPLAEVNPLNGSWPGFANGDSTGQDEVVLRDSTGAVMDTLVYEQGSTSTIGWSGSAVQPRKVGNRALEGQILYRIPGEATGLPVRDTDTAADWLQYAGNFTEGQRVLYPGWDLDPLFWPLSVTELATVVVGIAPDSAFGVVSQTIARAQRTLSLELYSLRHPIVITALIQKAQAGVSVTVLLEGQQVGVSHSHPEWQQELWACQMIEAVGGQCWFMIHDRDAHVFNRYDYLHAKYIIVDGEWVLVTSQNLTESSMPSDDKSNGTYGSRGVVLATDAPSVVARAAQVFALDLDPAHHNDLLRWNPTLTGTYGPPVITYTPQLTGSDFSTTTVHFLDSLTVRGTFDMELFTAPEAASRQSDTLLGLVAHADAGDAVYVEQLYEYASWGDNPAGDPNVRLEAYIAAARRGATVRILLNRGTFGQVGFQTVNTATVVYVNRIARSEGLDLEAAMADPTFYGIHNKMVLVWLQDEGGYVHVGSINGSESSTKANREMAIQIHSDEIYGYLKAMFDVDWRWSEPVYLPLVTRNHVPPADHLLVSEAYYWSACEWEEIHNPTPLTVTLTGYKVGDAQTASRYEGMYVFPAREIAPGEVIVVVGDATSCNLTYVPADYEMFGGHPGVPNLMKDPSWGRGDFALGNAGDEVILLSPSNRVVDVLVYGSGRYAGVLPHPGVDSGDTLERVPAYADTDDCRLDFRAGWSPGRVKQR